MNERQRAHSHHREDRQKRVKNIVLLVFLAILMASFVFFFLMLRDEDENDIGLSDTQKLSPSGKPMTLSYGGETYDLKRDMDTYLIIGTDKYTEDIPETKYFFNNEMADFLVIAVVDNTDETVQLIAVNRDTMCDVPWISIDNQVGGTEYEQICYAHSYGSGEDDSCVNTLNAVESFIFDAPIDHYVKFRMDSISSINDLVGGVTVTIEDNMTSVDESFIKGKEITLTGEQAEKYVRARRGVGDSRNSSRMVRQQTYMESFAKTARSIYAGDPDFITEHYDEISKYLTTDLNIQGISEFSEHLAKYEILPIETPSGSEEYNSETNYIEFYANEGELLAMIKEAFCA